MVSAIRICEAVIADVSLQRFPQFVSVNVIYLVTNPDTPSTPSVGDSQQIRACGNDYVS